MIERIMAQYKNCIVAGCLLLMTTVANAADEASQAVNPSAQKNSVEQSEVVTVTPQQQQFVDKMAAKYQLDADKMKRWIVMAQKKQSIIDAMNRPAEGVLSWKKYRKIFITKKRLEQGLQFWEKYQVELARAEQIYGVPAEIIVSIIGVETFYGRIKGNYRVLDALYTLAFHYPKRETFFRSELGHFFRLSEQQNWQPETRIGSYAGAMGYGQFMPSSYISYAVDFDNDGSTDLIDNPVDAIGSVANYFKKHGWKQDADIIVRARLTNWAVSKLSGSSTNTQYTFSELSEKGVVTAKKIAKDEKLSLITFDQEIRKEYWLGFHNFYVISRYNHSHLYSLAVYQLSQQLKAGFKPKPSSIGTIEE